jgi:predicted metal-dependent hydrolase
MLLAIVVVVLVLAWLGFMRATTSHEVKQKRAGRFSAAYIRIDDDGAAHELTEAERAYLNTEFHPADSGRPYVKRSYAQRTSTGSIGGFLKKSKLPSRINVTSTQ